MRCLLCKSPHYEVFTKLDSYEEPLVYYHCIHCGLIYQDPEESLAGEVAFYEEKYREIYQLSAEPTGKDLWVQEHRAQHLLKLLRSWDISVPHRVLDIGASAGVLMQKYQEEFRCKVVGVEPGDAYRKYAESQGLKMYPSLEELLADKPERFDLVSLIHVIEHLPNPVKTLRMIRDKLLIPNGTLLVEVPNFYAHDCYELAHLACYTPHTLQEVVRQAGFRGKKMKTHGVPRSDLLRLYLTLMAKPRPEGSRTPNIQPDTGVRFKRWLGLFYRRIVQKLFPHKAWLPFPEEEL